MKNEEKGEILELFCPTLDQDKLTLFNALVNRIGQAYPNYRTQIVQKELYQKISSTKICIRCSIMRTIQN